MSAKRRGLREPLDAQHLGRRRSSRRLDGQVLLQPAARIVIYAGAGLSESPEIGLVAT